MKRPGADHFVRDSEVIEPELARADFVGTPSIGTLGPERPGTIRIDAIAQAMHVKTVWHRVAVQDADMQMITGTRVNDRAGHPMRVDRLVHVGQHQFVGLGNQVARVQIFAVDQGVEPPRLHLGQRNRGVFMSRIAHAVAPVVGRRMAAGFDRTVVEDIFDFQVDIANGHCLRSLLN